MLKSIIFILAVLCLNTCVYAEQPNIILMMADDLGRECLECYGGSSYATPNINHLAEVGTRFECCYATPMCSPTRVMLMTGKYSFRNYTEWAKMSFDQPTVATSLKAAGYETAIFGKWHLGGWETAPYGPTRAGFDQFATFDYEQVVREGGKVGNQFWRTKVWENGKNFRLEGYGPRYYRKHALKFIRDHANEDAKPFFLYYPLALAHRPFVPTDAIDGSSNERTVRRGKLKNFPAMVSYIDSILGSVVQELQRTGLDKNTYIIFTADNGTDNVAEAVELRSRYRGLMVPGGKYLPTELGANVPLIVAGPGVLTNQVLKAPVDFTDIFPTLCELAKVSPPAGLDGQSLWAALSERDETTHDRLASTWGVFEHSSKKYKDPRKYKTAHIHIVRDANWKLLSTGQLFEINNDWQEMAPAPADQHLDIRSRLQQRMNTLRNDNKNLW